MKTAAILAALGASTVYAGTKSLKPRADVTPVTTRGNAFFAGNNRFYIRGVDYQPGGSSNVADPIADVEVCKRDIEEFTKLGANTIRIYSVDNSANHDECMKLLADAGIYLVLDLNTPKYSLNRADPEPSYNDVYLQNVFATIDVFAKYDNTLAFFSGNEVINDGPTSAAAPYVKAVTRDIRQYIRSRNYREIPVGYSAADVDSNRLQMAQYMNCGTDDERSDFFAFNDYSWCDPSDFTTSGWDQKVLNFTDYGLPLFLSEYGCNTNRREFNEVKSLYSTDMTGVYSGGLVYEYTEEGSKYGLVELNGNSVTEKEDFEALRSAFAATPNPSGDGGYNRERRASECPSRATDWDVANNDLPAIPEPAKKYMTEGAGKPVGLSGKGSQNAGTSSGGTATSGSGTATGSGSRSSGSAASAAPGVLQAPLKSVASLVAVFAIIFAGATML